MIHHIKELTEIELTDSCRGYNLSFRELGNTVDGGEGIQGGEKKNNA